MQKWIPAAKEQWSVVKANAEPHVQLLTSKTVEYYEAARKKIKPHVNKAQEFVDPYYQVHDALLNPYVLFV